MRTRNLFHLIVATIGLLCFAVTVAGDVDVILEPREVTISVGERLPVSVTIVNNRTSAVTLLKPGNGSAVGWRSPVVGWWIVDSRLSNKTHPPHITGRSEGRCGDINPLKREEIFRLEPGQSATLEDWIAPPEMVRVGKFRAVFHYRNVPDYKWSGVPLGPHDPEALELLETSTEVSIWSNEIVVTVIEVDGLSSN